IHRNGSHQDVIKLDLLIADIQSYSAGRQRGIIELQHGWSIQQYGNLRTVEDHLQRVEFIWTEVWNRSLGQHCQARRIDAPTRGPVEFDLGSAWQQPSFVGGPAAQVDASAQAAGIVANVKELEHCPH